MKTTITFCLGIAMLLFGTSCSKTTTYLSASKTSDEIRQLSNKLEKAYYMCLGHFSTEEQSKRESSPIYAAQEAITVPLWTKRKGEYWIYLSWLQAGQPNRLLIQEVWEFKRKDPKTISLVIHHIPNPEKYIYDWTKKEPLADLTPSDLITDKDCQIDVIGITPDSFIVQSHVCERNLSETIRYVEMKAYFVPEKVVVFNEMRGVNKELVYSLTKGLEFVRLPKSKPKYQDMDKH